MLAFSSLSPIQELSPCTSFCTSSLVAWLLMMARWASLSWHRASASAQDSFVSFTWRLHVSRDQLSTNHSSPSDQLSTNDSSPGHGLDQPGALVLHRLQLRPQLVVVAAVTLRTLQQPHFILEVSTKHANIRN